MRPLIRLFIRDLARAYRGGGGLIGGLVFLAALALLIAFAIGNDASQLRAVLPAAVVIPALLLCLFNLERLFAHALSQGLIEDDLLAGFSVTELMASRLASFAASLLAPLALALPLIAFLFGGDFSMALHALAAGNLFAIAVVFAGAGPAALAAERPRAGLLIALMVPPLVAPSVIFASGWLKAAMLGDPVTGPVFLLMASVMLSVLVGLVSASAAIRLALE
jgi:heme exporter protein B